MSAIVTAIIAFLSIMIPGYFLSLALLKKTKLNMFEIAVIGFMFGLIFPPTLTWLESYLMNYIHFFTFSATLYEINVVILTVVGIALCFQQGALGAGMPLVTPKVQSSAPVMNDSKTSDPSASNPATDAQSGSKGSGFAKIQPNLVWAFLLILMLVTFATRMLSIGIAPKFFEFDPYFDMQSTEFLLTHGYQWLYDTSAWPTAVNGTAHRIEPIVPYLEAYWYDLSNPPSNVISTTLLSNVSSFYPAIVAALLTFIVFMFLYHTYGEFPAIIGAVLATAMPALITTFIAGEQLVEPWGIFGMFFFYAAYLLAVQNMKEKRFAILAGIAFAASFLGAHYYTVIAGVMAIYIALQGIVDVLRGISSKDFYVMNLIVIGIIAFFYLLFNPYNTVLTNKIPSVLGIPVIVSFPLLALIGVALLEQVPLFAEKQKLISKPTIYHYLGWMVVLGIIAMLLIEFTPLGASVTGYLSLSSHFTTPSIALFMTVQEYEPTGFNFDFGAAGFGPIGASIFGTAVIVWFVLILFTVLAVYAIYKRDDKGSILAIAAVWPLAIAAMIEIKYLPHFGVGYIIALCMIIGELTLILKDAPASYKQAVLVIGIVVMLLESTVFIDIFSAVSNPSCNAINASGNAVGYDLYCNVISNAWLNATAWMRANVGPSAPRILSWWDYGDWINWFGNSNAVLRGDNSIAQLDYETAARYVLGPEDGYGPSNLANFSNNVVYAKYVLMDDQLTPKWQALDFLACVDINQTSRAFAISQAANTSNPYVLGTSTCEETHDPAYILLPLSASNIDNYCQFQGKQAAALKGLLIVGNEPTNETLCVPANFTSSETAQPTRLLDANGNETNILLVPNDQFFAGEATISGENYINFMLLYLPNGPNNTITDAPSQFYNSNYYRGFYLGELPGFHIAYPSNFTGINYVNGTWPVVIWELDNYTGPLPYVTPKPAWVQNNFTMPG